MHETVAEIRITKISICTDVAGCERAVEWDCISRLLCYGQQLKQTDGRLPSIIGDVGCLLVDLLFQFRRLMMPATNPACSFNSHRKEHSSARQLAVLGALVSNQLLRTALCMSYSVQIVHCTVTCCRINH